MPRLNSIAEHRSRLYTRIAAGVAVFSALATGVGIATGLFGTNRSALIDVAILLGLAYWVYRGSVVSAITLLLYHVSNRIYFYQTAGVKPGLMAFAYGAAYLLGIVGAVSLRRTNKTAPASPATIGGARSR